MFTLDELHLLRQRAELHEKGKDTPDPLGLLFLFLDLLEEDRQRSEAGSANTVNGILDIGGEVPNFLMHRPDAQRKPIVMPNKPDMDETRAADQVPDKAPTAGIKPLTNKAAPAPQRKADKPAGQTDGGAVVGSDGLKRGAWTDAEDIQLLDAIKRGDAMRAIAAALGRPYAATSYRGRMLRGLVRSKEPAAKPKDDGDKQSVPAAKAGSGIATRPPSPAPVRPFAKPAAPVGAPAPKSEPATNPFPPAMRGPAYPGPRVSNWTIEQDLALMEGQSMGIKIAQLAKDLGKPADECTDRVRAFLNANPGLDGQVKILNALRFHRDAEQLNLAAVPA